MYSQKEIYEQLCAMDAPKNSVVIIHSSLKAVGEVEGGGEGLLEVLIRYFTEDGGLLCIPTHTWHNVESIMPIPNEDAVFEEPTLDMNSCETCIGVLSRLAAAHPKAHRSLHPTHSMAVFGDDEKAEQFIAGEQYVTSSANPNGCYGKIYRQKGYVMLLGVGQTKNTFLHCTEEMAGVKNRLSKAKLDLKIKLRSGEIIHTAVHHTYAEKIGDVSKHYGKFEPAFRYFGAIKDGKLGNAHVQLCEAEKLKQTIDIIYSRAGDNEILADDIPLDEKLYK